MNLTLLTLRRLIFCLPVTLGLAASAATLLVSPSVVSNTYTGPILLSVGGLTNGEQVALQHFLDLNGNSAIDAGEPMIDAFKVRDGGAQVIGGVTNYGVPWDSNPATGAITVAVNFASSSGPETFVGNHVFRLESPTGRFSPQFASLAVTNSLLGATLTGTVSSGGVPVPNATVVALTLANQNLAGGVIADASGHYSLRVAPGSYGLLSVLPGYYTDQSAAPLVTLTIGGTSNVNLFLTNAQGSGNTISGQVYDSSTSNTLGGVFLQLQANSLFTIAFSDTTGNFTAPVVPAQWKLKADSTGVGRRGYVIPQSKLRVDSSTGSVANVQMPLTHGNAMFYGRITGATGIPLAGLDVYGQDEAQLYQADAYSDTNGFYYLSVVADNSNWFSSPDAQSNPSLVSSLISSGLGSTNISSGQAVRQDFRILPATASISGYLLDNHGAAVPNVGISANGTVSNIAFSSYASTGPSGEYSFNAGSGQWNLYVNCCGMDGLANFGLVDFYQHTITIPPTNIGLNIVVYPIGTALITDPVRVSPSRFGMMLNGAAGTNYILQGSVDLTNWFQVWAANLPNSPYYVEDAQATNSHRYYRVHR